MALTKHFVPCLLGDKRTAIFLISLFSKETQQVISLNPFPPTPVLAMFSFPAHMVLP